MITRDKEDGLILFNFRSRLFVEFQTNRKAKMFLTDEFYRAFPFKETIFCLTPPKIEFELCQSMCLDEFNSIV